MGRPRWNPQSIDTGDVRRNEPHGDWNRHGVPEAAGSIGSGGCKDRWMRRGRRTVPVAGVGTMLVSCAGTGLRWQRVKIFHKRRSTEMPVARTGDGASRRCRRDAAVEGRPPRSACPPETAVANPADSGPAATRRGRRRWPRARDGTPGVRPVRPQRPAAAQATLKLLSSPRHGARPVQQLARWSQARRPWRTAPAIRELHRASRRSPASTQAIHSLWTTRDPLIPGAAFRTSTAHSRMRGRGRRGEKRCD